MPLLSLIAFHIRTAWLIALLLGAVEQPCAAAPTEIRAGQTFLAADDGHRAAPPTLEHLWQEVLTPESVAPFLPVPDGNAGGPLVVLLPLVSCLLPWVVVLTLGPAPRSCPVASRLRQRMLRVSLSPHAP